MASAKSDIITIGVKRTHGQIDGPSLCATSMAMDGFTPTSRSLHAASGKENLHASVRAAATALGLTLATGRKRIRQGSSKEL